MSGPTGLSGEVSLNPDIFLSGTLGALNDSLTISLNSHSTTLVQVQGFWTGALTTEATVDGSNWVSLYSIKVTDDSLNNTITANGDYDVLISGFTQVRVRVSSYSGGSISISMNASAKVRTVNTHLIGTINLSVTNLEIGTVDQGTGGASPWLFNGSVTVNNFPASQSVTVSNFPAGGGNSSVTILNPSLTVGNISVTILNPSLTVAGSITVSNSSVTILNPSLTVAGSITVSNSSVTILNPSLTVGNISVTILNTSTTVTGNVSTDLNPLSSIQSTQQNVGITASQLASSPLTNRNSIIIKSLSTNSGIIYIGQSSGVTTGTGMEMLRGDSVTLDVSASATIYAISDTASQIVCILEVAK